MNKKKCGNCKVEKDLSEFHTNPAKKDGVQSMCKECRKVYHREHYLNNKEKYVKQSSERKKLLKEEFDNIRKNLCCSKCNEDRWYVLDFHHRNPMEKDSEVSKLVGEGRSMETIKKEIEKCDVLCSNCHRELHFLERNASLV